MEIKTEAQPNLVFFFFPLWFSTAALVSSSTSAAANNTRKLVLARAGINCTVLLGTWSLLDAHRNWPIGKIQRFLVESMKIWAKSHSRGVPKLSWGVRGWAQGCFCVHFACGQQHLPPSRHRLTLSKVLMAPESQDDLCTIKGDPPSGTRKAPDKEQISELSFVLFCPTVWDE